MIENHLTPEEVREHIKKGSEYIKYLEDLLFEYGAMEKSPCFICGYDGPGYYQPDQHPCAKRHHDAMERRENE